MANKWSFAHVHQSVWGFIIPLCNGGPELSTKYKVPVSKERQSYLTKGTAWTIEQQRGGLSYIWYRLVQISQRLVLVLLCLFEKMCAGHTSASV